MKYLLTFTLVLSTLIGKAQNCGCTIAQVESNTVESCQIIIGEVVVVSNTQELRNAIIQANDGGNLTVLIEDGTYPIASTSWYPYITGSNLVFRSASGNRDAVILTGQGMQDVAPGTEIVMSLVGDNITIADLTIRDCGNHGISTNSDNHLIHNVRIQDTYEQMIKGTSGGDNGSEDCIVQCSLFEYTDGIGPQWYIGGLDIHEGDSWIVRDNIFRDIASPSQTLAEHAIHFWDDSRFNLVERNKIINCDRGIGFGLGSSPNLGGVIRNNMIYNDGQDPFHDVGIGLETSPYTHVYNNTIHIQYPNAIEYRFESTHTARIANNLVNQAIRSRNGGQAFLNTNIEEIEDDWFVDYANGDLHLVDAVESIVNAGTSLSITLISDDFDQEDRLDGIDIGADEYNEGIDLVDQDMDGFNSDVDCNDMNPNINPDANEIPNNDIDEDCDGVALIIDEDMDGFNSDIDCDDMNPNINPDADEIPNNDIDEDCDDVALIIDEDMDGFNSDIDCDDMNPNINPDADEIPNNDIDEDCDGTDLITSVNDIKENTLLIYPNPSADKVNILIKEVETYEITITSINGNTIYRAYNSKEIDISSFASGMYILRLRNMIQPDQYICQKLIKD